MDIEFLIDKQRIYREFKENICKIINKLNNSIETLNNPSIKIKKIYNIDFTSVDNNKIKLIKEELIEKSEYLQKIILVQINEELEDIEKKIEGMM